jgi:aldehyde:ferredoxin oxidoreductase
MANYGFHGKVLHIDLNERKAWIEEPDERFWRVYGGGGLLATYYLMRETPAGIDAFDPANLLILTSSVVAGHPYAGLARFTAASKSPLTNGIGETRCEGPFGMALKGSGADAFVIHGASASPVTLLIENGTLTFGDASSLWGQNVNATVDALETQYGSGIHTAVIGPAGENKVRFASIVTDRSYQASRMGMGAVMGSKRLKAIVIRGDSRPPVADPDRCTKITRSYAERMPTNSLTAWQLDPPGFSAWVHLHGLDSALCVENYRDDEFPSADNYAPDKFMARYQYDGNCPGCPNNCIKFFGTTQTENSPYSSDPRAGAMHQEIAGALGPNCGITDLDAIFQANILCNEYGMDPTSLGFTLSMTMECLEQRCVDQQTIGLPLWFGDFRAMLRMIHQIAHREGFGNVLAEGSKRAAALIGNGADRFALHVKGLEMVCFEPRTQTNLAMGYATAPIGPRYDICEHDWDFDTAVGWDHTLNSSRTVGILERVPMQLLAPEKIRNFKALATLWSAADALDFCIFAIAPTRVLTLHEMADLLAAVTGWDTSSYEIMRFGERRLHLMRLYNLREGLSADDDFLPARFYEEPIRTGQWAGTRLDRAAFKQCVQTYYRMMGWDDDGRPLYETLLDHRIEWAAPKRQVTR